MIVAGYQFHPVSEAGLTEAEWRVARDAGVTHCIRLLGPLYADDKAQVMAARYRLVEVGKRGDHGGGKPWFYIWGLVRLDGGGRCLGA